MRLALFFLLALYTIHIGAQCDTDVQDIIQKVEQKIIATPAYTVNFKLDMSYVGESSQTQNGILFVDGDKFNLKLKDQSYISDGNNLCIVLSDAKELQILGLDDEVGMSQMSPIQLLKQYCSDDYLSAIIGTAKEDDLDVLHLEFTPTDKTEDIFKIRISYLPLKNEIYRIKTFSKDGSRLTLTATNYIFTSSHSSEKFMCEAANYPGFHVEDLR